MSAVPTALQSPAGVVHALAYTWAEARERLVSRLLIDEEWLLDGDGELTWWPWFLPQRVTSRVVRQQNFDGSATDVLRLEATTTVLRVAEETRAHAVVEAANARFPFGTFVWEEGLVRARTSVVVRVAGSTLPAHFTHACLIQATVAHDVAVEFGEDPDVSVPRTDHPVSGQRSTADELLGVFHGETMGIEMEPIFDQVLDQARAAARELLLEAGFTAGWSNHEVDFFNSPDGTDVAVGRLDGDPWCRRYGLGLVIYARWTAPTGETPDPRLVAVLSSALADHDHLCTLGHVAGGERAASYGMHLRTYLCYPFLVEHMRVSGTGDLSSDMAMAISTAAINAYDAAQVAGYLCGGGDVEDTTSYPIGPIHGN